MKLIIAIIRPECLNEVLEALGAHRQEHVVTSRSPREVDRRQDVPIGRGIPSSPVRPEDVGVHEDAHGARRLAHEHAGPRAVLSLPDRADLTERCAKKALITRHLASVDRVGAPARADRCSCGGIRVGLAWGGADLGPRER